MMGMRARSPPSEILTANAGAIRKSDKLEAFEAVFGEQARDGAHECGDVAPLAGNHFGVAAHGVGYFAFVGFRIGSGEATVGARHAEQGVGEQRSAATVRAYGRGFFARQFGDGVPDQDLQWVFRVQVPLHRPSVDDACGRHGSMLAGAVLGDLGGSIAGTEPLFALFYPVRKVGAVAERRFRQAVQPQNAPGRLHDASMRPSGWRQ